MVRRQVILVVSAIAFAIAASHAAAYPWPVKPFDVQHAIRGNFDDPRALRGSIDASGNNPLSFHSGVDIQAPDGTAVYAVESGQVTYPSTSAVAVASPSAFALAPLIFGYWHVVPAVAPLQHVARGQLLGWIRAGAGHVHFSERRFGNYLNPLRRGGLAPYRDTTAPLIQRLVIYRCDTATALDSDAVSGCVDLAVDAYDPPPIAPQPPWANVVLSPAGITWGGLFDSAWRPLAFQAQTVAFSRFWTVPLEDIYAPGTRMNGPNMPGDYRYWLARNLNTRILSDGPHTISVTATDVRGNETTTALQFTVANAPPR